ncbi:hypothetical protein [Floricoccus penangensis]|uniref:hypothetical protein n=1 Tax=Floricoccus penangensis TaxID=1859475 RepID=UPI00203F8A34|nr:hypothetical protein [Floricoccus penangensis]URZ87219.1 hypothetical protein KIW23_09085 [Floricoccus penangensis]
MAIKIYDICKQCFDEHSTTSVFIIGDFTNNDYHTITCSSGKHEIKYVSRKPEYPIFFQNGVLAYHKEEYFEAFTSIYHCYEMFRYTMVQIF